MTDMVTISTTKLISLKMFVKRRQESVKKEEVREELLGFVAIKGGTGGDGETMDSFTLLLSNQQQRVTKCPKMDMSDLFFTC